MIRLSAWIQRSASAASGIVMLYGCAAPPVDVPAVPTRGQIASRPGRPGFVVAAPHGSRDVDTGEIAVEIARRTGFGLVVASGFSLRSDPRAYETYERQVLEAAQGPLRFYAEIDDSNRNECAGQIEIATAGVDREFALRLRTLAELVRDAYLRSNREVQRLDVLIDPVDTIAYRTSGAKRDGILRLSERALHIELPQCARRNWREAYTAILADFLAQAATLPPGR